MNKKKTGRMFFKTSKSLDSPLCLLAKDVLFESLIAVSL